MRSSISPWPTEGRFRRRPPNPPTLAQARQAGEVVHRLHFRESGVRKQSGDCFALLRAVLDQQVAASDQIRRCGGDDDPDVVEAFGSRGQRAAGLERERRSIEVGITRRDVGRVGQDQVEWRLPGQGLEPGSFPQADPRRTQQLCVAAGHGEGPWRYVRRHQSGLGPGQGDGDGDGAAAGAEVGHAGRCVGAQQGECPFHQQFGLRARYQHVGCHPQAQGPELLPAEDLRDGFARLPPLDPGAVARQLRRLERALGKCDQRGPGARGGFHQQDLGVQARCRRIRPEALDAFPQRLGARGHAGTPAASRASSSAWWAPSRGSMTGSRSPASTATSW